MRKIFVLLSILIFVGCASYIRQQTEAPIVTIDITREKGHHATPDPVHVRQGHYVHFFLAGADDLEVQSEAFQSTGHDHGHAWALAKTDSALVGKRIPYTILVRGKTVEDPDVMIDP